MLELATRDVKCACRPCGLLFERADRMKLIPTDVYAADAIELTWEALRLPVDIAFFFRARRRDEGVLPVARWGRRSRC